MEDIRQRYKDAPVSSQAGMRCCGCGLVGPRARRAAIEQGWHQIAEHGEYVTSARAEVDILCPDCKAYYTLQQMQGR